MRAMFGEAMTRSQSVGVDNDEEVVEAEEEELEDTAADDSEEEVVGGVMIVGLVGSEDKRVGSVSDR